MIFVYLAMFCVGFPLTYFNLVDFGVEKVWAALIAWLVNCLFITIVAYLGAAIFAGDRRPKNEQDR